MYLKYLSMIFFVLIITNTHAQNLVQFSSQVQQTTMIELYSSQGCSSCPPAERWISKFIHDDKLWENTVPVVFHVDYWNDLGWVDPFSNASNSKRQRIYHRQRKINSVYTPGFIINGNEWRGGEVYAAEKDPGVLRASLGDKKLKVIFDKKESLELHIAILGIGLETDVKSGENRDKMLREDFIALTHQKVKSDKGEWQIELPNIKEKSARRFALAIWVSLPGENAPMQSTGGWLPENIFGN